MNLPTLSEEVNACGEGVAASAFVITRGMSSTLSDEQFYPGQLLW